MIESFAYNTSNGDVYVYLNGDVNRKKLKCFLNFKNEKVYFIGSEKNKNIFTERQDLEKINKYLVV